MNKQSQRLTSKQFVWNWYDIHHAYF